MTAAVHVLVPEEQVLYRDALQTLLEAESDAEVVAVVADESMLLRHPHPRDTAVFISAGANEGESIRLAHRLCCAGVAVGIFDAPEDPVFHVAAFSSGVTTVLPRSGTWANFHAGLQRLRGDRRPVPRDVPLEPAAWHDQRDTVVECLDQLPDDGRRALSMSLRGLSVTVIATRLGADVDDVAELVRGAHRALEVSSTVAVLDVLLRLGLFEAFVLRDDTR